MAEDQDAVGQEQQEALEKEAKTMGWVPKEQFRGSEEDFVDAKEFVDRGRQILPIVQANNQRLVGQVNVLGQKLGSMEEALKAANATIEALEESHGEDVKAQVEAARAELKEQLEAASRDGDHAAVADLTDKMTQLNTAAAPKGNGEDKGEVKPPAPPPIHPDVQAWMTKNADFMADPRRVALANVITVELRQAGETAIGGAFLDKVAEEVDKTLGARKAGSASRVSPGGGGRGRGVDGGGGAAKSYADLPAEAKAACDKMSKRLVGPNRAHKDETSWRASYAKQYFAGEQQ